MANVILRSKSSSIFLLDQDNNIEELLYRIRDIALYYNNLSERDKNLIKHWLRNTVESEIVYDIEEILNVDKSEVNKMTSNVSKCINEYFENAKQEGLAQGMLQKEIEIAKNLLDILDDETISIKTGIDIETVKKLRLDNMN